MRWTCLAWGALLDREEETDRGRSAPRPVPSGADSATGGSHTSMVSLPYLPSFLPSPAMRVLLALLVVLSLASGAVAHSGDHVMIDRQVYENVTMGVCVNLLSTPLSYVGERCYRMADTGLYAKFSCNSHHGDITKINYGTSSTCSGEQINNVTLSTECVPTGDGGAMKWACVPMSGPHDGAASSIAVSSLLLAALAAVAAFIKA